MSKSACEITLVVPVDAFGARGFDFTLKFASDFDDMVINSNLYSFFFKQLFCIIMPTNVTDPV